MFNFSAGPATLPVPVLEQTQSDLINYQGSGMSVMEMSHRGPEFTRIIEEAEADLRKLMEIPDNYKVLFLQGGASQQFSAIPFNLTQPEDTVDQVSTSHPCPTPTGTGRYVKWAACSVKALGPGPYTERGASRCTCAWLSDILGAQCQQHAGVQNILDIGHTSA